MERHIEDTMARVRGDRPEPNRANRPRGTVWHGRHPDHPMRLEHPLPQTQVAERVAELMQDWSPQQYARYNTFDPDTGAYADWPDVVSHIRTARDRDDRWEHLNRQGIWVDTRLAWSYWDPTDPLLCILTFPFDETCQFIHRTPPNSMQMWHVSLCHGRQHVSQADMLHLVQNFDNRTMQLWGQVQGNAYYLNALHDPIARDPVVQRLESLIGRGIHISM